ncbi:MAG: class I SAM-dependent methyltransferase [Nitrospira sp.]|nr:class I SAM-dependent methyltransferase [Nitrospira sp.]
MGLRQAVRRLVRRSGYDIVRLQPASHIPECFPPGHFYSVIPSLSEVTARAASIFSKKAAIRAVKLNAEAQIQLLREFSEMGEPVPFYSPEKRIRFDIENNSFSYDDAPILHYMLRRLHPKRVVEIGSGNSSACMLDTNDLYLDYPIDFTFIDINCEGVRASLREKDLSRVRVVEQPIQDVDLELFSRLQGNDLLFIDSSHVMKAGSDLATILFDVLPVLAPGVCVHFHDVRYPFQYQQDAVLKGVLWNEAYLLRAFLMYNASFDITFWLNYLVNVDSSEVADLLRFLPLAEWDRRFNNCANEYSSAGGSIYLTKK